MRMGGKLASRCFVYITDSKQHEDEYEYEFM